ncbi:hypothetical protein ACGFMM_19420 [Streptomyces sp. NPDC048604]|uniref:hypothetical protein n=1 Tax=Streptomyces sp. NPDC048604 TaxID=3365578 RepID=UPI0037122370
MGDSVGERTPAEARTDGHDDVRDTDTDDSGAPPGPGEPVGPAPLGVERTPTGHAAVDALLERLADADHLPADGHLEVYEDVHRGLRDELTSLDAAARPGPTPTYDHRS